MKIGLTPEEVAGLRVGDVVRWHNRYHPSWENIPLKVVGFNTRHGKRTTVRVVRSTDNAGGGCMIQYLTIDAFMTACARTKKA